MHASSKHLLGTLAAVSLLEHLDHNIYQAGLMIRFALAPEERGDERVSEAWQEVVEVFQEGNRPTRAIDKLEKSYYGKQAAIRSYLQFLIQNQNTVIK